MPADPLPSDKRPWWKHPLLPCVVIAAVLVRLGELPAGEQYPLTSFPMYSNLESSADMLMIRNERDELLPMSRLFNVGSAQVKKRFESTLREVAGTKNYEEVSPEKLQQAAGSVLKKLWDARDKGDVARLAQPPRKLRAIIRTVSMNGTDFKDEQTVVGELDVSQEGGAP
ncbi:MAG: hypothetical protein V4726_04815 [Verrucomicrobiota bacterium]